MAEISGSSSTSRPRRSRASDSGSAIGSGSSGGSGSDSGSGIKSVILS